MNEAEILEVHAVLSTMAVESSKSLARLNEQQRITASFDALVQAKFSETQLQQLLAVAVDRLAIRLSATTLESLAAHKENGI